MKEMLNKISSTILGGLVLSLCAERNEAFWQNVVDEFKSSDVRWELLKNRVTTKMLSYHYSTEYLGRILVLVLF